MPYNYISENSAMRIDMNNYNSINNIKIQRQASTQKIIGRNSKKSIRFRSVFTTEQIMYLEKEFKKYPYLGNTSRQEIASVLKMPERAIKIWFQNRRMKEKKELSREVDNMYQNKLITFNLTNDQLNNVNNLQSTNDEVRITTSLKTTNEDSNVNHGITKICKTSLCSQQVNQAIMSDSREHEITTTTDNNRSPNVSSSCEDYQRNKKQVPQKNLHNKTVILSTKDIKQPHKDSLQNMKLTNHVQYSSKTQEIPEDLSQRKGMNSHEKRIHTENVKKEVGSTPIFIQNCFTPSSLSGNVVLKPINMTYSPIIPGITPLHHAYHPGSHVVVNQPSLRKSNCQCDCHLQFVPQVIQDQSQGQYIPIFTIPYTNPV